MVRINDIDRNELLDKEVKEAAEDAAGMTTSRELTKMRMHSTEKKSKPDAVKTKTHVQNPHL